MSILFVLLTFLLIISFMYFRRPETLEAAQQLPAEKRSAPVMLKQPGFEVPEGFYFHPGHTWLCDEGRQNARVGVDAFASNLIGEIDSIELADLNRWVRQGQRLCTLTSNGQSVELLSPVEGVVVSVNHQVLKNPKLITEQPYGDGWLCMIKAPELAVNTHNLLQGTIVPAWMQNSISRLGSMVQQLNPALAQDGGLPVRGLLFHVDPEIRRELVSEFFLT